MGLTIDQALRQGVAAYKEGKLHEAEKLYRSILGSQPAHPDANHNLGVLAVSVGRVEDALPFFKVALGSNPKQGQFWLSYIDALIKVDQLDAARQVLQQGKDAGLKGDKVDQLGVRLGTTVSVPSSSETPHPSKQQIDGLVALYSQGNFKEALVQGNALADQFPNDFTLPNILGAVYAAMGQHEEAIISYNKATELKPDFADAYSNLGSSLNNLGRSREAIAAYNKSVELKPTVAEVHYNLGNALNNAGKLKKLLPVLVQQLGLNRTL
jgi:tetratricopeptide (TPR) repeat protein